MVVPAKLKNPNQEKIKKQETLKQETLKQETLKIKNQKNITNQH